MITLFMYNVNNYLIFKLMNKNIYIDLKYKYLTIVFHFIRSVNSFMNFTQSSYLLNNILLKSKLNLSFNFSSFSNPSLELNELIYKQSFLFSLGNILFKPRKINP